MIEPNNNTSLVDLPTDILGCIFPYLEPTEFLNLCSTSKALATLSLDSSYWRYITRSTYRIPNQPLLRTDGARWKTLYQRLQTESRVYTWGSAAHSGRGGLGHANNPGYGDTIPRYASRYGIGWPTEMFGVEKLDPIVDLQCGGWSTTVLTSKGDLYSTGMLDGQHRPQFVNSSQRGVHPTLELLRFLEVQPEGQHRIPMTTIAQFSSGRSHVLGLSDTGTIWFWRNIAVPALEVRFLNTDMPQGDNSAVSGDRADDVRVTRVVAGWASSSAYVTRKGIVVWSERAHISAPEDPDVWTVDDAIVPDTYYQRPRRKARETSAEEEALGKRVGEVVNHIVLEGYVVFLTDLGKVFTVRHESAESLRQGIVELAGFGPSEGKPKMTELQGSFRSFAVFNTEGDVVIGDRDLLDRAWERAFVPNSRSEAILPVRPPALQNQGVISLAFGDWHRLALTRQGRIMSFGQEPSSCGCLGLGSSSEGGLLRGVWYTQVEWTPEGDSQQQWRQVWFSPEQREWLRYMANGGIDQEAGRASIRGFLQHPATHLQVADSIEKNGSDWDLHPDLDDDTQPWGRSEPAYLVLSIAAAGWHCGALVLANQKKIRKMYHAHAGFLPPFNGFEQPPTSTALSDANTGVLSSVWDWTSSWKNWLSAWWMGGSQAEQGPPKSSTMEDQQQGHEHSYYHSSKPWNLLRRDLPDAAKHEVFFPAVSSDDVEEQT
ncbi:MAG: hypothetical protein M1816_001011 [Peltula sp. TS41687]|nr:MAG: hypothetical protein M1816_001011 [Peltula sp. TS41687]